MMRSKKVLILIMGCIGGLLCSCSSSTIKPVDIEAKTMYKNRIENIPTGEFGDPYILRYDGYYYLYPSAAAGFNMKVYRSENLVDWVDLGEICDDGTTIGAYAPEVKYYNGRFYLCTSPSGNGHYILSSDKPEGPFKLETDNFKMNIDGSFFIDDDGKWYFFNAASKNIEGRSMSSPTEVDGDVVRLGTSLNHWTEGPMVIKRNGIYYLTYTGNHLISRGYRIAYATSTESPLGPYQIAENNPLIISTKEGFSNLGHSSSFLGPDLDSWYITYHDMESTPADRGFSIDRLSFNGKRMYVSGPTDFEQPVPNLPDFCTRGTDDNAKYTTSSYQSQKLVYSKANAGATFTAEYNLTNGLGSSVVFGLKDEKNFGYIHWNQASSLDLYNVINGKATLLETIALPVSFDAKALHTLRLASDGEKLSITFDNMQCYEKEQKIGAGAIGYLLADNAGVSYTAFSNVAFGSSDQKAINNLPSEFAAVSHASADANGVSSGVKYRTEDTSRTVYLNKAEQWVSYAVNTCEQGLYSVALECSDEYTKDFELEVYENGHKVALLDSSKVSYAKTAESGWKYISLGTVELQKGLRTLTFKLKKGTLELRTVRMETATKLTEKYTIPLNDGSELLSFALDPDGVSFETDGLKAVGVDNKLMTAVHNYTDLAAEVTIKNIGKTSGETGLVIRMKNASYHEYQIKEAFTGYLASVTDTSVTLRHNDYETQSVLGEYTFPQSQDEIQLRMEASGATVRVYVDGKKVIEAVDPRPITTGGAGIYLFRTEAVYRDLIVSPLS